MQNREGLDTDINVVSTLFYKVRVEGVSFASHYIRREVYRTALPFKNLFEFF